MTVVVDATVAVAVCFDAPYSAAAEEAFIAWRRGDRGIFAPSLWWYESTSTVRKLVAARNLTSDEGTDVLRCLADLNIQTVETGRELARSSFQWADRLGHFVAYDGAYLACAERLEADFYTGDRRLVRRARDLGLDWVRDIASTG